MIDLQGTVVTEKLPNRYYSSRYGLSRYTRWSRIHGELHGMVGPVQKLGTSVLGRSSRDIVTREMAASDHIAKLQDVSLSNSVIHF
jgi:hypothetical protein